MTNLQSCDKEAEILAAGTRPLHKIRQRRACTHPSLTLHYKEKRKPSPTLAANYKETEGMKSELPTQSDSTQSRVKRPESLSTIQSVASI
jgi:hypothetical protein